MYLIRNCTDEYLPMAEFTRSQEKFNKINQLTTNPDQQKDKVSPK